jgi:hypothetical protein
MRDSAAERSALAACGRISPTLEPGSKYFSTHSMTAEVWENDGVSHSPEKKLWFSCRKVCRSKGDDVLMSDSILPLLRAIQRNFEIGGNKPRLRWR